MIHKEQSNYAEKIIKIKNDANELACEEIRIEDWWDRVGGGSWMGAKGNPACLIYAMRSGLSSKINIPIDNEVLYGKINGLGYLVHIKELEL